MNPQETQAWLARFQASFASVLCSPLDSSEGELRAELAGYDRAVCENTRASSQLTAAERLAVYNRQYWFRLFGVLQHELPLTSRLLGAWYFNQYAMRFLRAQPPREPAIQRVADGFEDFLAREITCEFLSFDPRAAALPRAALLEAAQLDATFRRVFLAPEQPRFEAITRAVLERSGSRLQPSAACARLAEHWPLLELRASLLHEPGEAAIPLPERSAAPQHWLLARNARGVVNIRLQPRHAHFYALLEVLPIDQALGQFEAECSEDERAQLPHVVQRWLASGVQLGIWSGVLNA